MFSLVLQQLMKLQEPQAQPCEGMGTDRGPASQRFSYSPLLIYPGCKKSPFKEEMASEESGQGEEMLSAVPSLPSTAQQSTGGVGPPWLPVEHPDGGQAVVLPSWRNSVAVAVPVYAG